MGRVIVRHPTLGSGVVRRVSLTLPQQQEAGQPSHLVFVRWDEPRGGVAGGWYNPMDERFTIEGAVWLARMFDEVLNGSL